MPIYEYFCQNCQRTVQIKKPMANVCDPERCSDCVSEMKRIYSPAKIEINTSCAPNNKFR